VKEVASSTGAGVSLAQAPRLTTKAVANAEAARNVFNFLVLRGFNLFLSFEPDGNSGRLFVPDGTFST
jgi:hypothetical protein